MDLILAKKNKKIYKNGDYLTKVFNHDEISKSTVFKEALYSSLAESTCLPIPHVLKVYSLGDDWAIDSEYIEGETLEDMILKNPTDYKKYIDILIDWQLKILSITVDGLPNMKDKFNSRISRLGKRTDVHIDATIRYELHIAMNRLSADKVLCHGDFVPDNLMVTPEGKFYILDWAHSTVGNKEPDIARTYLNMLLDGHKDWAEYYLKSYTNRTDTAIQQIESWYPEVAATMMNQFDSEKEREFLLSVINGIEFA